MRNTLMLISLPVLMFLAACGKDGDKVKPNLDTPSLSASQATLGFGNLDLGQESAVMSFELTGEFLTENVTLKVSDNFQVSLQEDEGFTSDDIVVLASDFSTPVSVFAKATPEDGFEGQLTGTVDITSAEIDDITVSLSASVALVITGDLLISEFFEQYGAEWETSMPLDSGILGWDLNTDTVMNQANAGGGYPESTVANNEIYNVWYSPVPLNSATLSATLGLSDNSTLAITGYPSVSGARDVRFNPDDAGQYFNWVKEADQSCVAPKTQGSNSSMARRFAADGNSENLFLSALISIEQLGSTRWNSTDDYGTGDIMALANATSGPANNNNIKVVAISDEAGGFQLGLIKENEGNPEVLSEASFAYNTTYAIIMSYEFVEGDNNDVAKLYVFEEGDEIPNDPAGLTPVAVLDETYGAGVDPTDLTIVFIRERTQAVETPFANLTGIRVGTSWVATLFSDHSSALNSNDLTLNNRVLVNSGSTCGD